MSLLAQERPADTSAPEKLSGAKRRGPLGSFLVERPGAESGSWEQWLLEADSPPSLLKKPLPRSVQGKRKLKRILCLPSRSLHDWPLWIAGGGDPLALARLELSGRHLIKRGMEQSLGLLSVGTDKDRQLMLAICPEEPFPEETLSADWRKAGSFDLPIRTLGNEKTDLLVWKEWGRIYGGFLIGGKPVWFCPVDEENLGGLLLRTALRLQSEGILRRIPEAILLAGIPAASSESLRRRLAAVFPSATLTLSDDLPLLAFPPNPLTFRRLRRGKREGSRQKKTVFSPSPWQVPSSTPCFFSG